MATKSEVSEKTDSPTAKELALLALGDTLVVGVLVFSGAVRLEAMVALFFALYCFAACIVTVARRR